MINQPFHHLQQTLAFNIKEKRKVLGVTQEQLALEAEIDRTYVSQIERGIGNPSLLILVKIAHRLETDVLALLTPNLDPVAEDGHDES
jgi:transcriptional regulator with XRE-family HTH domain